MNKHRNNLQPLLIPLLLSLTQLALPTPLALQKFLKPSLFRVPGPAVSGASSVISSNTGTKYPISEINHAPWKHAWRGTQLPSQGHWLWTEHCARCWDYRVKSRSHSVDSILHVSLKHERLRQNANYLKHKYMSICPEKRQNWWSIVPVKNLWCTSHN